MKLHLICCSECLSLTVFPSTTFQPFSQPRWRPTSMAALPSFPKLSSRLHIDEISFCKIRMLPFDTLQCSMAILQWKCISIKGRMRTMKKIRRMDQRSSPSLSPDRQSCSRRAHPPKSFLPPSRYVWITFHIHSSIFFGSPFVFVFSQQPGPFPVSHVDLAEFSLNALLKEKLYNTCPYVVADSF